MDNLSFSEQYKTYWAPAFDMVGVRPPLTDEEMAAQWPAIKREWIRDGVRWWRGELCAAPVEERPTYFSLSRIAFRFMRCLHYPPHIQTK